MVLLELLKLLDKRAGDYREHAIESLARNQHLVGPGLQSVDQKVIDAVLVDFINYVGMQAGVDYAMSTRDLGATKRPTRGVSLDFFVLALRHFGERYPGRLCDAGMETVHVALAEAETAYATLPEAPKEQP